MREQAGDFYMSPAWGESVVFAARSIEDAGRAQGYMAALLDERVDVVGQMRAARHRLERERDRAEDAAASLSRTGARIRADRALLESLTKKMRALAEGVAVSFGRGSADFARAIAAAQAGQPAAATMDRFMFEPLRGRLSSPYGPRVHPIYGYRSLHTGLDIAAAPGTPVVAARDGAVVTAGPAGPFGLAVVVDHGERIATVSAHLSAAAVAAGDRVRAGDVIGLVGCTGWCTGPHLHFEVWFDGITRDPAEWIVSVPAVAGARTLVGGSPASHPIRARRAPADQSLAGLRNPFEDLSAR